MCIQESDLWKSRWQALDNAIKDFRNIVGPYKKGGAPGDSATTIDSILECLHSFGERQFNFFLDGFTKGVLVESPRYKAEFALRRTLDQMAYDLSLLQRAYSHRNDATSTPRERATLDLADKLAYKALQPAKDKGLLKPTTVLTYFQKSSFVRVIPYAPVAMIGIPHTCTGIFDQSDPPKLLNSMNKVINNVRDFLAIPHEIGHYVFWHSQDGRFKAKLRSQLPDETAWRNGWLEEIFADVYGVAIAGPAQALDFQELLGDNLDLTEDDGDHPVGMIRPYLLTYTLGKLYSNAGRLFPNAPEQLDNRWQTFLRNERGNPNLFKPKNGDGTPVTLYQARTKSQDVIDIMTDGEHLGPILPYKVESLWSKEDSATPEQLYQGFKKDILEQLVDKPDPTDIPPVLKLDGSPPLNWNSKTLLFPWFNVFEKAVADGLPLMPESWGMLLEGGGWAAGGPEGSGNPPTGG